MKALQLHIIAMNDTFLALSKGKYLAFFIPGLIMGLLFWRLISFTESFEESHAVEENIPLIGEYLQVGVSSTFSFFGFILKQIYIFIVLTVLSPFNTILSEKIDTSLTEIPYPFDIVRVISDFIRMIFVVFIILILELLFMGIYWLISAIFGLDFMDEIAFFIIAAFFYGFSFYDYSLERYQIGVFGSLTYAFKNGLKVTLSGAIFLILYSIPIAGVILAPVLTTMVATFVFMHQKQSQITHPE